MLDYRNNTETGIRSKPAKAPYRKPEAVKELERLAFQERLKRYPNHPASMMVPVKYRDDSANSLTKCIVKYVTLKGGFASRINSAGVYNQRLRKYVFGTQKRGIADTIGTWRGKSLMIEVKHGRDVQSEDQKEIESEVIRAGGLYHIAKNFTEFKSWFDSL